MPLYAKQRLKQNAKLCKLQIARTYVKLCPKVCLTTLKTTLKYANELWK